MNRSFFPLALLAGIALVQTSPLPLHALDLGPAGLEMRPVPPRITPLPSPSQADFKGDGRLESLAVSDGHAALISNGQVVWQSPDPWLVIQAAITDLDHDGRPEASLLVWRPFRPWPVDRWLPYGGRIRDFQNADGQSCHLILIGWRRDRFAEVWAGSALADPLLSFSAADLDGDGVQELVTLEGTYANPIGSAPARALKVWEWNGFGFSVVDSIDATFTKMVAVREANGHTLILVP